MIYRCRLCRQASLAFLVTCPSCRRSCTFEVDEAAPETVEARREALATAGRLQRRALAGGDAHGRGPGEGGDGDEHDGDDDEIEPIEATVSADYADVPIVEVDRAESGVGALDWVLGDEDADGCPTAYCVVFGGRRGGGKSTLARQWLVGILRRDPRARAAYLVREEGLERVARGVRRLLAEGETIEPGRLRIAVPAAPGPGGALDALVAEIRSLASDDGGGVTAFAVDSMLVFARGPTHCAEVGRRLQALAESLGVMVLLIAHMNGEGRIAGGEAAQHAGDACLLMETLPGGVRKLWCDGKHRFGPGDREAYLAFGEVDDDEDRSGGGVPRPRPGLTRIERARALAIVRAAAEEEAAAAEAEEAVVAVERARLRRRRGGRDEDEIKEDDEHEQA